MHERRDKSTCPVSVHRRVLPGTGGQKYLIFGRDMTHRHEYACRLKASENENVMIFNAIHKNPVTYERDFHFIRSNDDPKEWAGLSPEEQCGCVWYVLLYGRTPPREGCVVKQESEKIRDYLCKHYAYD